MDPQTALALMRTHRIELAFGQRHAYRAGTRRRPPAKLAHARRRLHDAMRARSPEPCGAFR